MNLPEPEVGLVIHFNYLWKREHDLGRDHARYARPCAIVLAQRRRADGAMMVLLAPVTHAAPMAGAGAVEIPQAVRRHLGLDGERSWIVTDELNEFAWPGFDLQPNAGGDFAYGVLPNWFYQRLRGAVIGSVRAGRLARVPR